LNQRVTAIIADNAADYRGVEVCRESFDLSGCECRCEFEGRASRPPFEGLATLGAERWGRESVCDGALAPLFDGKRSGRDCTRGALEASEFLEGRRNGSRLIDGLLDGGCEAGRNSGAGEEVAGSSLGCDVSPAAAGREAGRSCSMDCPTRRLLRPMVVAEVG